MTNPLRNLKLKTRMTLVLGLMALLQTGFLGLFALNHLNESLEEQVAERALQVAKTIAVMPEIIAAVKASDTAFLQPLSLQLAEVTHARFVVIGDKHGLRLSHPTLRANRQTDER